MTKDDFQHFRADPSAYLRRLRLPSIRVEAERPFRLNPGRGERVLCASTVHRVESFVRPPLEDFGAQLQLRAIDDFDSTKGHVGTYYLPWATNFVCWQRLASEAEMFLTPTLLTCCVLIWGGRTTPTVVHANYGLEPGDAWEDNMTDRLLPVLRGDGLLDASTIPTSTHGFDTTVFGSQSGGEWTFYKQRETGGGHEILPLWP